MKVTYSSGDVYDGEFANGLRNGFGMNNNQKLVSKSDRFLLEIVSFLTKTYMDNKEIVLVFS